MKRIFNFIILFVVCLLPTVVEAKVDYDFDWSLNNRLFWYKENNEYNFFELDYWDFYTDYIYTYDENGSYIEEKTFSDLFVDDFDEFLNSEEFETYQMLTYYYYFDLYDKETDTFYSVAYDDGTLGYYDSAQSKSISYNFEENLELTNRLLGEKYSLYLLYKDNFEVLFIDEMNGYYVVYLANNIICVHDSDLNGILNFEYNDDFYPTVFVKDDLVYISINNITIDIYKIDGTKYDSITIDYDGISVADYYSCSSPNLAYFYIIDNELYVIYNINQCPERIAVRDAADINNVAGIRSNTNILLKYTLDYDIDTVSSSNGEFTYETKVDEDGKSYVELKITPKDGYSVEDIIVTDINGNRIEVTNNKFYKPLNDVKIEVKYINGEYLPIPNTALSQSITVIIIGVILVGLGFYTINYVRSEEK